MIYFFADDHYGAHPGKNIFEKLPGDLKKNITFVENDWTLLESGKWLDDCELLILNMIGATCNLPHPNENAEKAVRSYCEKGGNALLLHGSSAAFWQWDWWRRIVGLRWVRPNDPDNVVPSVHPVKPYSLRITKNSHPLSSKLVPFALEADEIYTELEQVSPVFVLMDTFIEEGVYPQCAETITPWNGKFVSFIPGHSVEAASNPALIQNITAIINYLIEK